MRMVICWCGPRGRARPSGVPCSMRSPRLPGSIPWRESHGCEAPAVGDGLMSVVPALARIPVGVVVERRRATSPWIDFTWQPLMALPGRPDAAPWTVLSIDAGIATFYAGSTEIVLYRTEGRNYRDNLAYDVPLLWIALPPTGPPRHAIWRSCLGLTQSPPRPISATSSRLSCRPS